MTLTLRHAGILAKTIDILKAGVKKPVQDFAPPRVLSSVVRNSAPRKLVVTFDKNVMLNGLNGLSVSNNSFVSFIVDGNVITFTLNVDVPAGTDSQTWTYDNSISGASLTSINNISLESDTFQIDNTVGQIRNEYSDAYSLAFAGGYATVAQPPVMTSWVVNNSTPGQVDVIWDKPSSGSTGITVSGIAVTSLSFSGTSMTVNLGRDVTPGESLTLSYAPGDIVGDNGELVVASGPHTITNNVQSATPPFTNDDTAQVDQGQSVDIDITANDNVGDYPIDKASVNIVTGFSFGTQSVNTNGILTYINNSVDIASDFAEYTVDDTQGNTSNTARVDVAINIPPAQITPHLVIDRMASFTGSGALSNGATTDRWFFDYNNDLTRALAGEIVIEGARRIDHADGIDYGYGVLGIEYDSTTDGSTPITPAPELMHDFERKFAARPATATATGDYASTNNIEVVTRTDVLGTIQNATRWTDNTNLGYFYTLCDGIAGTQYTIVMYVKMDDNAQPVVSNDLWAGDFVIRWEGNSDYVDPANVTYTHLKDNIYKITALSTPAANRTTVGIYFSKNASKKLCDIYYLNVIEANVVNDSAYYPTTAAEFTTSADDLNLPYLNNWVHAKGVVLFRFNLVYGWNYARGLLTMTDNAVSDAVLSLTDYVIANDGTNTVTGTQIISGNQDIVVGLCYESGTENLMTVMTSTDGGATFDSVQNTYDGGFAQINDKLHLLMWNVRSHIKSVRFYNAGFENFTVADMVQWVRDNAQTETDN